MPVNCSAPRNQASAVKVQVANPRNTCYTMPCHVLRAPVLFHHEMLCNWSNQCLMVPPSLVVYSMALPARVLLSFQIELGICKFSPKLCPCQMMLFFWIQKTIQNSQLTFLSTTPLLEERCCLRQVGTLKKDTRRLGYERNDPHVRPESPKNVVE